MGEWRLEILGPPQAVRDGETVKRLRTKRDRGVLASLAMEPGTNERAALARRFWPEALSPSQNLRVALSSIRSALGADILVESDGTLRLSRDCRNDLQEMRDAVRQAKRLTDSNDAARKAALLREGALWIRGPFLEGAETTGTFGWIEIQRERFRSESIALLSEWLAACRICGDEAGMADAAQRLLTIDPDDEAAQNILLQSRLPLARRLNPKMDWSAVRAVLAPLPPINGGLGGTETARLAVSDAVTLQSLMEKRLDSLPAALRRSLRPLSLFPDSFTAEQAEAICGVVSSELDRFIESQLLHFAPVNEAVSVPPDPPSMGGRGDGNPRYCLRGAVREILWRRLTGEERSRLQERHARFFAAATIAQGTESTETLMLTLQDHIDWLQTEIANLSAARDWFLARPPQDDGVMMLVHLCDVLHRSLPQNLDFLEPAFGYLTAYIETGVSHDIAYNAMGVVVMLATNRHDSREALEWQERAADLRLKYAPSEPNYHLEQLLMRLHHAAADAHFDRLAEFALSQLNGRSAERQSDIRGIIAENYHARRRFAEALEHNDHCLAFHRAENKPQNLVAPLYMRGCILKGLGRNDEARNCWNEAMELAEAVPDPHTVANCLTGLARICRESGALSEAKRHALEAVALFRTVGDVAAVHVASATLGDILRDKGDPDAARALYEPGLAFWREKNHARWIGIFEEKMAKLGINSQ